MRRIMIIGCGGAGKSTLTLKMTSLLGIEAIHLDKEYWKPNWVETSAEEWEPIVKNLVKRDRWIMDGNYGGTMEIRLDRADTVIFLNYSTLRCFWGVLKRIIKNWGKTRYEMPDGCVETFDPEFLWYVLNYRRTRTKKIIKKLKALQNTKNIFIFKNDSETEKFVSQLQSTKF